MGSGLDLLTLPYSLFFARKMMMLKKLILFCLKFSISKSFLIGKLFYCFMNGKLFSD